jgi:hypothetical protein
MKQNPIWLGLSFDKLRMIGTPKAVQAEPVEALADNAVIKLCAI